VGGGGLGHSACGILVPGLGIKLLFPGRFLTLGHQGGFKRKAFLNSSRKTEISGFVLMKKLICK
jgi:hypothetical protein